MASIDGRGRPSPPISTATNSASAAVAAGSVSAWANPGDQRRVSPARTQSLYRVGQLRHRIPRETFSSTELDPAITLAPAPPARRCDTAAQPTASCPVRRAGRGRPRRWRSSAAAVVIRRPLGGPVPGRVARVNGATSICSPTAQGAQQGPSCWVGTATNAGSLPPSTVAGRQQQRGSRTAGTCSARRMAT